MVDTVILILHKDMFKIGAPEAFSPSAKWVANSPTSLAIRSKQNPTKKELQAGIYKPRLTLTNRIKPTGGVELILKVEFSLPKLLFGNNFDELARKDFAALTRKLAVILNTMGISTTAAAIEQADVSGIHYSKNIPLTDGSIPFQYINKIREANIQEALDKSKTEYRIGHSFKWHCNSYEVIFYDKIKDLEAARKSNKRSLEKDSELQLELFERFKKQKKFELLRMEVRLNKRQKAKSLFKKLGIKSDFTFKSLFKVAIAKRVLLHYLEQIESKRPAILDYSAIGDKNLLATLVTHNAELNSKYILQIFGLKKALESFDIRELRAMLSRFSNRTWYRLIADANKIKLLPAIRPLEVIKGCISKFKPLRIST